MKLACPSTPWKCANVISYAAAPRHPFTTLSSLGTSEQLWTGENRNTPRLINPSAPSPPNSPNLNLSPRLPKLPASLPPRLPSEIPQRLRKHRHSSRLQFRPRRVQFI